MPDWKNGRIVQIYSLDEAMRFLITYIGCFQTNEKLPDTICWAAWLS